MRVVLAPLVLALAAGLVGCGGVDDGDGAGSDPALLEGVPWVLASGVDVPEQAAVERPTATFERGTVSGSTGCNRYSAPYALDGGSLEIGQIAATLMGCQPPAGAIERDYVATFARVAAWRVEEDELVLLDADDEEILRYTASPGS